MELGVIKDWLGLIAVMISVGVFVHSWLTSGSKTNATALAEQKKQTGAALEAHGKKLTDHDRRIQSVEAEMKHLPDKDTVLELKLAIAELKTTVAVMGESMGSIGRTVHRIDDYLRKRDNVE